MGKRTEPSGIILTAEDASIVKGMLARDDRQHDIAAWFGVNGGRIAEIATRARYGWVERADEDELPPHGPYPAGRVAVEAMAALTAAKAALASAEAMIFRPTG
jgi:hypothetical protein